MSCEIRTIRDAAGDARDAWPGRTLAFGRMDPSRPTRPTRSATGWRPSPAGPARPPLSGDGARGRRRGRRRVHRPVDRDRADRHGPLAAGRRSSRRRRSASARAAATAASASASLTHGLANGIRHFPDELAAPRAGGHRQPARARRVHPGQRDRLRPRGDRRSWTSPTSPTRSTSSGPGSTRRPSGARSSCSWTASGDPGGGPLAALAGRASTAARAGPRRDGRPGQARPRPGPRREERGVAIHERTRVTAVERRAGGVVVRTADGRVGHAPTTSSSRRRPTRAGCGRLSSRSSCPSTTTRSCRSR